MSIISALLGICLYVLTKLDVPHVLRAVAIVGGVGFAFFVIAVSVGARAPRLTAAAYQASILFAVALGALLAYGIILVTASLLAVKGSAPSPSVEALIGGVVALLAVFADRVNSMSRLMPAHLAEFSVRRRYETRFPKLRGGDPVVYRLAYEAIFHEALSDSDGSIHGWGFDSTRRRLALVRTALL